MVQKSEELVRVGIVFPSTGDSWIGGLNYLKSLITALSQLPSPRIQSVIFSAPDIPPRHLEGLEHVEHVRSSLLKRWHPSWVAERTMLGLSGSDWPLERLLSRHGIQVHSHGWPLGKQARIPTVGWIPDFQHIGLPKFFTRLERCMRDREYRWLCRRSARIVVSSRDSLQALRLFSPSGAAKGRVLRFVPELPPEHHFLTEAQLMSKYGLVEPFLHLPNQFWRHKNHEVVIRALAIVRQMGKTVPLIVSTGSFVDYRHKGHFQQLKELAKEQRVDERFITLGVVPYHDSLSFMKHSQAVINPSLFEGWSTTVEESKALGKAIILSNIPVHREQSPQAGKFFDPRNATTLAPLLLDAWQGPPQSLDPHAAALTWEISRRVFAETYEQILLEAAELTEPAACEENLY